VEELGGGGADLWSIKIDGFMKVARPSAQELRSKVAHFIKMILQGEMSLDEALSFWPAEEEYLADPLLCEAYHVLQHFEADEDIRHKDPQYAEWQIKELKEIIQRLGVEEKA
jgi:hypothetical protein